MKRYLISLAMLLVIPFSACAEESTFALGKQYQEVTSPLPTDEDNDKIVVTEIFWYGCPHCFSLEPKIKAWAAKQGKDVIFKRIPAAMNRSWEVHARAYYTAEVLGILEKIHNPLFEAIHVHKQALRSPSQLAGFFEAYGVDKKTFDGTYNSFSVDAMLNRSKEIVKSFNMHSVPSIAVNNKYWTNSRLAGDALLLNTVDHLIEKIRNGK